MESRSSGHSLPYPETRPAGLRQRRKSRTSIRESRWKYPPDLPYDELLTRLNPQERKFFDVLDDQLEKVRRCKVKLLCGEANEDISSTRSSHSTKKENLKL